MASNKIYNSNAHRGGKKKTY